MKVLLISLLLITSLAISHSQTLHSKLNPQPPCKVIPTSQNSVIPVKNTDLFSLVSQQKKSGISMKQEIENLGYAVREFEGKFFVAAIVSTNESFNQANFTNIGIRINSIIENLITCHIPIESLSNISKIEGVLEISISKKSSLETIKAKEKTNVDNIHRGIDLPKAYMGEGIIIGIVDMGFDYNHPFFLDMAGKTSRISRIWDHYGTGTPPDGYGYGNELTGDEITNATTDYNLVSHGSCVAGIAGGGYSKDYDNCGIAPKSELVFVSYENSEASIIDAINYIFDYAESVNKPAVVNLSFGFNYGAYDGTELFSSTLDALTGNGKILVTSAGNWGAANVHLSGELTQATDSVNTFLHYFNTNTGNFEIVLLGSIESDFSLEVGILNEKNEIESLTTEILTSSKSDYSFDLLDKDVTDDPDTIAIDAYYFDFKGRSSLQVFIDNSLQDDTTKFIYLKVKGDDDVELWAYGCQFTDLGMTQFAEDGDSRYSITDPGNARKIITVGAYVSNIHFTTLAGKGYHSTIDFDDWLLASSSNGPTFDDRVKPEISAPGKFVNSAANSYDVSNTIYGEYWKYLSDTIVTSDNHVYYWGVNEGTSIAAPVVSGIVALLLEQDPTLDYERIVDLITTTAIHDIYTGSSISDKAGYGKIDAHAALKKLIYGTGVEENQSSSVLNIFPNPISQGELSINVNDNTEIQLVEFYNITGKKVYSASNNKVDISKFESGIYNVMVYTNKGLHSKKLIVQ